jgi:hypothetical protein
VAALNVIADDEHSYLLPYAQLLYAERMPIRPWKKTDYRYKLARQGGGGHSPALAYQERQETGATREIRGDEKVRHAVVTMTSIFVYERDNFKFITDHQLRNQSFKVVGAGRGDTNYGMALAEKRLA